MIEVLDKGVIDYGTAWEQQKAHFDRLLSAAGTMESGREATADGARGVLMLCEHPHVYTLGKSGHTDNLLVSETFLTSIGASYYHIDRGGDITYHGYGQLVGYPILDLSSVGERGMGLKEYIHLLEESVIATLAEWGIEGKRIEHATGVWLSADAARPERKICAIGVKASRFVTMHGFALNVTTDLRYFDYINPCGFTDKGVTSIKAELVGVNGSGRSVPGMEEVKRVYVRHFRRSFEGVV
ncbi:lipoyl(octanoyl) transferase LipB [uncultured Rikenella sp.]|uniref:lipoyl(octanoyl) transferase LipB n=1 Tax=uncultured Rikenella sp. TaxID=368003 RepID=UPI00261E8A51|nr:lipoyl(octanoyl) transferase LipB [uncultured Rikenella sp.]